MACPFKLSIPYYYCLSKCSDERRLPNKCSIVGTSQQVLPHTICKKAKLAAKNYYYFFVQQWGDRTSSSPWTIRGKPCLAYTWLLINRSVLFLYLRSGISSLFIVKEKHQFLIFIHRRGIHGVYWFTTFYGKIMIITLILQIKKKIYSFLSRKSAIIFSVIEVYEISWVSVETTRIIQWHKSAILNIQ